MREGIAHGILDSKVDPTKLFTATKYLPPPGPIHGAQTDVGNREFLHEYNAVCGKTGVKHHCRTTLNLKSRCVYYVSLMNSQKLNGESTPNILVNEAV